MKLIVFPDQLGLDYTLKSETDSEAAYLKLYYTLVINNEQIQNDVVYPGGWHLLLSHSSGISFVTNVDLVQLSFCLFSCVRQLEMHSIELKNKFRKWYE